MIRELDPSNECDNLEAAEDAELGQVLESYLANLEAGRSVDRERLLAAHPAIAAQLRACLEVMHLAERVADDSVPDHAAVNGTGGLPGARRLPNCAPGRPGRYGDRL